jgi:DNA-binding PadR family transcriptional regulator
MTSGSFELTRAILTILSEAEAKWDWYKLDRALARRGVLNVGNVAILASELAVEGLLDEKTTTGSEPNTYEITAKGLEYLTKAEIK